jgi:large subunit ribosomal protein L5
MAADTTTTGAGTTGAGTRPRLKQKYESELKNQLKGELGLVNVMQVPRLEKIVVNMGVGRATQQRSLLDGAVADLTIITGQKPSVR